MPTTAWKFAGTGSGWTNSSNITSTNGVDTAGDFTGAATANAAGGFSTPGLIATNFGFTTSDIPSGSTILGIEYRLRLKKFGQPLSGYVYAVAGGLTVGTQKTNVANPTDNNLYSSPVVGGASDLWGTSWTDSQILASNFGVRYIGQNLDAKFGTSMGVDSVECRVTYSSGATTTTTSTTTTSTTTTTTLASRRPTLGGRGLGSPYIGGYRPGFLRKD